MGSYSYGMATRNGQFLANQIRGTLVNSITRPTQRTTVCMHTEYLKFDLGQV